MCLTAGAMVIMPDAEVCRQIVEFYLAGARNKSDARGFYGFNARHARPDTCVHRNCGAMRPK